MYKWLYRNWTGGYMFTVGLRQILCLLVGKPELGHFHTEHFKWVKRNITLCIDDEFLIVLNTLFETMVQYPFGKIMEIGMEVIMKK